jgi:capsular polysaccharide biosynthesis protein
MEDEIDLRKFIDVLLRHWKLIVSITVIAVFTAGLVSFLSPRVYEARATVMILGKEQESLLSLARSPHVATAIIEQLGGRLKPGEQKTDIILDMVETRARDTFLEVTVRNTDPEKAAAIANAWTECYIQYSNDFLTSLLRSPQELEYSANATREVYERESKAYEDFRRSSHIDELTQQISDKELLYNAMLLREQIQSGHTSVVSSKANSLAFVLLLANAYIDGVPANIQVSLDLAPGETVSLKDIDNLISILETRTGKTSGKSPVELQQRITELRIELDRENSMLTKLKQSMYITWISYMKAVQKITELEIALHTPETMVIPVEPASTPDTPVGSRKLMTIGIALVLGLVVAVFGAFVVEYFKKTGEKPEEEKEEREVS